MTDLTTNAPRNYESYLTLNEAVKPVITIDTISYIAQPAHEGISIDRLLLSLAAVAVFVAGVFSYVGGFAI